MEERYGANKRENASSVRVYRGFGSKTFSKKVIFAGEQREYFRYVYARRELALVSDRRFRYTYWLGCRGQYALRLVTRVLTEKRPESAESFPRVCFRRVRAYVVAYEQIRPVAKTLPPSPMSFYDSRLFRRPYDLNEIIHFTPPFPVYLFTLCCVTSVRPFEKGFTPWPYFDFTTRETAELLRIRSMAFPSFGS